MNEGGSGMASRLAEMESNFCVGWILVLWINDVARYDIC